MSRQGYLILHEKRQAPKVCFFSLEDGFLRYYAHAQSAKMLGEVRLSGCKIVVKAHRRTDGVPNSFYLETRKVNVKDRSYTLGAPVRLELSAHSNDDRQEWGKVLFSWQRYYWRDPRDESTVAAEEHKVKTELEQVLARLYPNDTASNQVGHGESSMIGSTASAALSAAKQPLSFLRKNASSLRRSFSMYMPSTTTSSTSTASSSTASSVSSSGKGKADASYDGPEATDCEKDKVVLAKVAYPSEPIYRGDNQQESCVF